MKLIAEMSRAAPGRDGNTTNKLPWRRLGADSATALEMWRDVARTGHDVTWICGQTPGLESHVFDLDRMVASRISVRAQSFTRTSWHIRQRDPAYLRLKIYERGDCKIQAGDLAMTLRPGSVYLVDHSRAFTEVSEDSVHRGIYVAHSTVGYDPSRHQPVVLLDKVQGSVLAGIIDNFFGQLPEVTDREAPAITAAIAAYIRTCLGNGPAQEEWAEALRTGRTDAMRHFIDRHLGDRDLGVERLQAMFGVSRATIYRDFEEDGGVSRYVTDRRLESAYRALASEKCKRGFVQEAAERWHFSSADQFTRLFRKKFGCTPSEIAARRRSLSAPGKAGSREGGSYADVGEWVTRVANGGRL
jgi:AraC-like DNA-binding protein